LAEEAFTDVLNYNIELDDAGSESLVRQRFVFDILVRGHKLPYQVDE